MKNSKKYDITNDKEFNLQLKELGKKWRNNMTKIIIITFESGKKEAFGFKLETLEFIESNIYWIIDVEIIDINDVLEYKSSYRSEVDND